MTCSRLDCYSRPKVGEQMYHKKGVYASHIKQNFHGSFQMAEARRTLGCYDNNMFATAWVTSSLIESYLHSNSPKPSENQIKISLDSFDDHHDHNRKYNNSLMTFWEQVGKLVGCLFFKSLL